MADEYQMLEELGSMMGLMEEVQDIQADLPQAAPLV